MFSSVMSASKLTTTCYTDHLSQYGSGFYTEVNTVDFEFIFTRADFADNATVYMCLIVTFFVYLVCLIYGLVRDRLDLKKLAVPFLKDNDPENTYMYELIVETGPLSTHATTSRIYFILTGDDEDTGTRCFNAHPDDLTEVPKRSVFNSGAVDSFLVTTPVRLF